MKKAFIFWTFLLLYNTTNAQNIALKPFATGFTQPITIANAGDNRLFIAEQGGLIKILTTDGNTNSLPYINLSGLIIQEPDRQSEQGLLGLAFHPNYSTTGYFYVYYINPDGDSVIDRYQRDTNNPDLGDINTKVEILTFNQTSTNHNGGHLAFGPDKKLYIGSGDGGGTGDPNDQAQDTSLLLGKILRLDIDMQSPYIPIDNPFVGIAGEDEIWAYGLRNPWKFSFDNQTGDLWVADVGQRFIEEVNKVSSTTAGLNYGWPCFEGSDTYDNRECPNNNADLIFPIAEYTHNNNGAFKCSITGGYIYRGTQFSSMQGQYIFADYCSNEICMIANSGGAITYFPGPLDAGLSAFGEDVTKELYAAGRNNGTIYKVVDEITLEIPENTLKSAIIYPNPADTHFTIDFNEKISSIALYDIKGKLILTKESNFESSHTFNINSLPRGLYIIKVLDINKKELNHKITIQ